MTPNDFFVRSSRINSRNACSRFDLFSLSFGLEAAVAFLLFVLVSVATLQFTTSRQSYLSSTVVVLKNDELTNNDLLEIIVRLSALDTSLIERSRNVHPPLGIRGYS